MRIRNKEAEKPMLRIEEQVLRVVAEEKGFADGEINERIEHKQSFFSWKVRGTVTRAEQLAKYMKEHHLDEPDAPEFEAIHHMTLFEVVRGNPRFFATLIERLRNICPGAIAFDAADPKFNMEDLKTWKVDEVVYHFQHKTEKFPNDVSTNKVQG